MAKTITTSTTISVHFLCTFANAVRAFLSLIECSNRILNVFTNKIDNH